jgi:hypothetical protein
MEDKHTSLSACVASKSGCRPFADRHHRAFGSRLHEFRPLLERGAALCQPVEEVLGFRYTVLQTTKDQLGRLFVDAQAQER